MRFACRLGFSGCSFRLTFDVTLFVHFDHGLFTSGDHFLGLTHGLDCLLTVPALSFGDDFFVQVS